MPKQTRRKYDTIQSCPPIEPFCNDNIVTDRSGLRISEQVRVATREADLDWQINFIRLKLRRWDRLSEASSAVLTAYRDRALMQRAALPAG